MTSKTLSIPDRRPRAAPLIGLYSSVMRSGKSTVAELLEQRHGFERVSFARPLKDMVHALGRAAGFSEPSLHRMTDGNMKESPIAQFGSKSPRELMQTLGTEWGREIVSPDLWVKVAMSKAYALRSKGSPVVIDDMRFPNEASAILDKGGILVRVDRFDKADGVIRTEHPSEGLLDDAEFTFTVPNHGTLKQLEKHVGRLVAYTLTLPSHV